MGHEESSNSNCNIMIENITNIDFKNKNTNESFCEDDIQNYCETHYRGEEFLFSRHVIKFLYHKETIFFCEI